ncbi:hypothetical protein T439DRAFT_330140 [Meredithblackwellia eburnea MCA 4105]
MRVLAVPLLLLATLSQALVIVQPSANTVWEQNGSDNIIEWALYPLTYPTPTSQYFDIYIRNGVGQLYTPFLNVSIAHNVDSLSSTSLAFLLSGQFLAGTGYQLWFTDPNNANTYYCQSDVFSIAAAPANGITTSASSTVTVTALLTSTTPSSTRVALVSTTSTPKKTTATTTITSTTTPKANPSGSTTVTTDAAGYTLHAATNPGGPAEQHLSLTAGASASLRWMSMGGVLALSLGAAALLV